MEGASIKIPAELFALAESSRFEGSLDLPELSIGPDIYRFAQPIHWEATATNTGEAILIEGSVNATGATQCARCLDDVAVDFAGAIEGYFLIGDDVDHPEDLDDDEFDVLPDDHVIDLVPLIEAALIVEAPNMPLCREDCKGICPQCGANLNDGPCGCAQEDSRFDDAQNPFAVLKSLAFDDDGPSAENSDE